MTVRDAILRAVPIFSGVPNGDLYRIRDELANAGIPASLAAEVVEFLPLAVARAVLNGMGIQFEDYYTRQTAQGRVIGQRKLLDEPVYREGLEMADEISRMGEDAFMALASLSAEFRAINKALKAGSRPEDLTCSPPIVLANNDDPRFFDNTSSGMQQRDKRWWQIWK
jgi:hypothetical protein